MAKLKRKKKLKDVTGDGKFTYADVLKMRGVKLNNQKYGGKVMGNGGKTPMRKMPRLIVGGMTSSPRFDDYETAPTKYTPEMIRRLRDNARSKVAQGLKPSVADYLRMDIIANPEKNLAMYDKPFATGLEEKPMMKRKADILRERGLVDPMRYDIPEDVQPMSSRKPGEIMGYGGKVKLMKNGGTVDYAIGGLLAAGAAGLGQIAQRSEKPFLQKAGKVASMLGNLSPVGKAVNMAGNFLQNFNPTAGAQQAQQGVRDTQAVAQAAPQQGSALMNLLQSPMAQNIMNQFTAKHGMKRKKKKVSSIENEKRRLNNESVKKLNSRRSNEEHYREASRHR
jgi:hypothetical protein